MTLIEELEAIVGESPLDVLKRTENPLATADWEKWANAFAIGKDTSEGWEPGEHTPNEINGAHWHEQFPLTAENAIAVIVDFVPPKTSFGGVAKNAMLMFGDSDATSEEKNLRALIQATEGLTGESKVRIGLYRSTPGGPGEEFTISGTLTIALVVSEGFAAIFATAGGEWFPVILREFGAEESPEGFVGFMELSKAKMGAFSNFRVAEVSKAALESAVAPVTPPTQGKMGILVGGELLPVKFE